MADKPILEKKFNEDVNVEEQVKDGAVLSTLYLEVQGNDKDTAKEALERTVFEKMLSEEYVTLLEARLFEIKKDDKDTENGVSFAATRRSAFRRWRS